MQGWLWYLLFINTITGIVFGWDKWQSRRRGRRLSEAVLIGLAAVGGTVGALLGMFGFHHKTRHLIFRWGLPIILLVQMALGLYFWTF